MMHAPLNNEGTHNLSISPAIELESLSDSSNDPSGDEVLDMVMSEDPEQETVYNQTTAGTPLVLEEKDDGTESKMRYLKIEGTVPHTDNRLYNRFSRFRLFFVAIVILTLMISRLLMLSDISNITTTITLENITEFEVPFVVFRTSSTKTLPFFYNIQFVSSDGEIEDEISFTDIKLYSAFYSSIDNNESLYIRDEDDNIVLFSSYDEFPNEKWSRIYVSPKEKEEYVNGNYTDSSSEVIDFINAGIFEIITEILVPPKSLTMDILSTMDVQIISYSGIINRSSDDITMEYILSKANGFNYGFQYFADNTQQLKKYGSNAVEKILDKFSDSITFFALPAQHTYVHMEHYEVIDDTSDGYDDDHYSLSTGVDYFDLENAEVDLGLGDSCNKPALLTSLHFVPHPAHAKFAIHRHYIFDVWYVFMCIGGALSPLLTLTAILLVWLTWGMDCKCRRVSGVAPLAGFDDVFKKKLDAYLVEQGLIVKKK